MKWKGWHIKKYSGIGETFKIKRRYAYCEKCKGGSYPVDEAINLPRDSGYLNTVQEVMVMAGINDSYEEAEKLLKKAKVIEKISHVGIRNITMEVGAEKT